MNKKFLQSVIVLWALVFSLSSCAGAGVAPVPTATAAQPAVSPPTSIALPTLISSPTPPPAKTEAPPAETSIPPTAAGSPAVAKSPEAAVTTPASTFETFVAEKTPCYAASGGAIAGQDLAPGEALLVQARDAGGGWYLVKRAADGLLCWVESGRVTDQFDQASLPEISLPATNTPTASVADKDNDDDGRDVEIDDSRPEPTDAPYP